jgi:hypothetical protein
VGVDDPHRGEVLAPAQELVVDGEDDLAVDGEGGIDHEIEGGAHHAGGGVLHRHHAVVGLALLHRGEDRRDVVAGDKLGRAAELAHRRQVGKRAIGPEMGDAQGLFQGKAGRHYLAEDDAHRLLRQGAGVGRGQAVEDLGLALRHVEHLLAGRRLVAPHLLGEAGAPIEQRQELIVQRIDAPAQLGQVGMRIGRGRHGRERR